MSSDQPAKNEGADALIGFLSFIAGAEGTSPQTADPTTSDEPTTNDLVPPSGEEEEEMVYVEDGNSNQGFSQQQSEISGESDHRQWAQSSWSSAPNQNQSNIRVGAGSKRRGSVSQKSSPPREEEIDQSFYSGVGLFSAAEYNNGESSNFGEDLHGNVNFFQGETESLVASHKLRANTKRRREEKEKFSTWNEDDHRHESSTKNFFDKEDSEFDIEEEDQDEDQQHETTDRKSTSTSYRIKTRKGNLISPPAPVINRHHSHRKPVTRSDSKGKKGGGVRSGGARTKIAPEDQDFVPEEDTHEIHESESRNSTTTTTPYSHYTNLSSSRGNPSSASAFGGSGRTKRARGVGASSNLGGSSTFSSFSIENSSASASSTERRNFVNRTPREPPRAIVTRSQERLMTAANSNFSISREILNNLFLEQLSEKQIPVISIRSLDSHFLTNQKSARSHQQVTAPPIAPFIAAEGTSHSSSSTADFDGSSELLLSGNTHPHVEPAHPDFVRTRQSMPPAPMAMNRGQASQPPLPSFAPPPPPHLSRFNQPPPIQKSNFLATPSNFLQPHSRATAANPSAVQTRAQPPPPPVIGRGGMHSTAQQNLNPLQKSAAQQQQGWSNNNSAAPLPPPIPAFSAPPAGGGQSRLLALQQHHQAVAMGTPSRLMQQPNSNSGNQLVYNCLNKFGYVSFPRSCSHVAAAFYSVVSSCEQQGRQVPSQFFPNWLSSQHPRNRGKPLATPSTTHPPPPPQSTATPSGGPLRPTTTRPPTGGQPFSSLAPPNGGVPSSGMMPMPYPMNTPFQSNNPSLQQRTTTQIGVAQPSGPSGPPQGNPTDSHSDQTPSQLEQPKEQDGGTSTPKEAEPSTPQPLPTIVLPPPQPTQPQNFSQALASPTGPPSQPAMQQTRSPRQMVPSFPTQQTQGPSPTMPQPPPQQQQQQGYFMHPAGGMMMNFQQGRQPAPYPPQMGHYAMPPPPPASTPVASSAGHALHDGTFQHSPATATTQFRTGHAFPRASARVPSSTHSPATATDGGDAASLATANDANNGDANARSAGSTGPFIRTSPCPIVPRPPVAIKP